MAYTTIDDPSAYFQTKIYTDGDATTDDTTSQTFDGNSNLQPDWIWFKSRNVVGNHGIMDTSRGLNKVLKPNATNSEATSVSGYDLLSMDSNGFSYGRPNQLDWAHSNPAQNVVWAWKCNGGTTSSNTSGDITTTVQANTTAGFSIFTYTGTGTTGDTIGHGLGAVPDWIWIKARSIANDQTIYHSANTSAPETDFLILQGTDATSDSDTRWNDTAPTSTLITLGNNAGVNGSTQTYVGYAFAEKQGYSKFGSYTGISNDDGAFVYTGFAPAWVMIKRTDTAKNWYIFDNKRPGYNVINRLIAPNLSDAEVDGSEKIDLLSNGFKLRQSFTHTNTDGGTFIYMAFAEHPFVSSEGVPTTAR